MESHFETIFTKRTQYRAAWGLAILVGVLVFFRESIFLDVFGDSFPPDSLSYVTNDPQRTVPYIALNTLLHTTDNPLVVVYFQVLLAALAAGFLVAVLGKMDLLLALMTGTFLALDTSWTPSVRTVYTEGVLTSFLIISLACLVDHYAHHQSLRGWQLLLAGVLYGWTFTIRPNGFLLMAVIVPVYLWFTRSWRKSAWVAAGLVFFWISSCCYNYYYHNTFALLAARGPGLLYPLFDYDLYSPENGPNSRALEPILQECVPDEDLSKLSRDNLDGFWYTKLAPCVSKTMTVEEITALFDGAYKEAALKKPVYFAKTIIDRNKRMLAWPIGRSIHSYIQTSVAYYCVQFSWCKDLQARAERDPALRAKWTKRIKNLTAITAPLAQLHLTFLAYWPEPQTNAAFSVRWVTLDRLSLHTRNMVVAAWIVMNGFTLLFTRKQKRFLVLVCLFFIHYTLLVVVTSFIFYPRYAEPLSPFYSLLSLMAIETLALLALRHFVTFAVHLILWARGHLTHTAPNRRQPLKQGIPGGLAFLICFAVAGFPILGARLERDQSDRTNRATSNWLEAHLADDARLAYEYEAQSPAHLACDGQSWDCILTQKVELWQPHEWLDEGTHYLLIDQRTDPAQDLSQRIDTLVANGATLLYRSDDPFRFGIRQAVLWTFHPQYELNVTFDNSLYLAGYHVLESVGQLDLLFHWYTVQIPDIAYHLFLHVIDPKTGETVGQVDVPLGQGFHPTNTWRKNEIVFETISIPADLLAKVESPYVIHVGLYDLDSGARAIITDKAKDVVGDHLILTIP